MSVCVCQSVCVCVCMFVLCVCVLVGKELCAERDRVRGGGAGR